MAGALCMLTAWGKEQNHLSLRALQPLSFPSLVSLALSLPPALLSAKIRARVEHVWEPPTHTHTHIHTHGLGNWREGWRNKEGLKKKTRCEEHLTSWTAASAFSHVGSGSCIIVGGGWIWPDSAVVKHSHGATEATVRRCKVIIWIRGKNFKDETRLPLPKSKQQHITSRARFAWWHPMSHMSEMILLAMSTMSEKS